MIDLSAVVNYKYNKDSLIVTDMRCYIIADEILKSLNLFDEFRDENDNRIMTFSYPHDNRHYRKRIKEIFDLDIENNNIHAILWDSWINLLTRLDMIQSDVRCNFPSRLLYNINDKKYLLSLIDKEEI